MSRRAPHPAWAAPLLVSACVVFVTAMVQGGCGGPSKPKNWKPADSNAVVEQAPATTAAQPDGEDATAGPAAAKAPAKKKPRELWARHNAKRLDELTTQVGLSAEERTKLETMWATERTEILRLMLTERGQPKPNWAHVHSTVLSMREDNDTQAKAWLGDTRFEAYLKIRPQGPSLPKVKVPEKPEPPDSDDPGDRGGS